MTTRIFVSGVTPANQTKERPVHEPMPGANLNQSSKFMNFSSWPFLFFGLPGRLLIVVRRRITMGWVRPRYIKWAFLRGRVRTLATQTVRGTGTTKRGFMQLKGGAGSCHRALGSSSGAIGSPCGPSFALMWALFNCLIHLWVPGF